MRSRIFAVVLATACICGLAAAGTMKPYFGNLHSHTSYSDGMKTPDAAYKYAKKAGLDFLAVTDHNHKKAKGGDGVYMTRELYEKTRKAARKNTRKGKFVAICGQEFSTIGAGNHVNIFEASKLCDVDNGEFRELYGKWLADQRRTVFAQFNHPNYRKDQNPKTKAKERNNDYGIDDYKGSFADLVKACEGRICLIELIIGPAKSKNKNKAHFNGKHEKDYLFYLDKGFRLGASAGQDNHKDNWGTSTAARVGVWLEKLSKRDLLEALSKRRCYASEDENMEVKFTIGDKWMGDSVELGADEKAEIEVAISDPDESKAEYTVKLYYDEATGDDKLAKVVEQEKVKGDQDSISFTHQPKAGGYYFVKVTQKSPGKSYRDDVWTSPIWIE